MPLTLTSPSPNSIPLIFFPLLLILITWNPLPSLPYLFPSSIVSPHFPRAFRNSPHLPLLTCFVFWSCQSFSPSSSSSLSFFPLSISLGHIIYSHYFPLIYLLVTIPISSSVLHLTFPITLPFLDSQFPYPASPAPPFLHRISLLPSCKSFLLFLFLGEYFPLPFCV